jgi:hypothetical protein
MADLDLMFSEDGDIELGVRKLDAEGQVLYMQKDSTVSTIKKEGSREVRDVAMSRGRQTEKQIIINRINTQAPDWFHHTTMGGNLSDLVGEPNTKETAEIGKAKIIRVLTYKDFLHPTEINVKPVPTSQNEILFIITISKLRQQEYKLPLVFNLSHGLVSEYQTK